MGRYTSSVIEQVIHLNFRDVNRYVSSLVLYVQEANYYISNMTNFYLRI